MINTNFNDYPLSDEILKAMSLLNYDNPTNVQQQVIPAVFAKQDIIVRAQTGSGKTAAFAIPICELVDWEENRPQALIIAPTRELAIQIKEDVFNIGRFKRLKVSAVYGKAPFHIQREELKQKTHVVAGTPGRIIDHIEKRTLDVSRIKYVVIDEADELLNMGFVEQLETIMQSLAKDRVTMLFSATMPADIRALCDNYMKDPVQFDIEEQSTTTNRITQFKYIVEPKDKMKLLRDIMVVENPDSCMIFCNTKQKVDEVSNNLVNLTHAIKKIHGGMEQSDRQRVMEDFKKGHFRYLVATDVAARGIDIEDISLIINYDLPLDGESYVHRIGRTARFENTGSAISFVTKYENKFLNAIEQYIGQEIPLKDSPNKETIHRLKQVFTQKISAAPKARAAKGAQLNNHIIKLHINAGKKTKMRPVDIVGTLCSIKGMTAADIGIINITDVSAYVEILNNKGELVFKELQTTPIKGRLRKVSRADR